MTKRGTKIEQTAKLLELKGLLTDKQLLFCHEYVIDWNGKRAAEAAGYSLNCAREQASQNLRKPLICEYIGLIKRDLVNRLMLTKERVVREWIKIAFSNITNYLEVDELGTVFLADGLKLTELPSEVTDVIASVKEGKNGLELTLYDKTKALAEISKLMGYNEPLCVDAEVNGSVKVDYSKLSAAALEEIARLDTNENE